MKTFFTTVALAAAINAVNISQTIPELAATTDIATTDIATTEPEQQEPRPPLFLDAIDWP